MNVTLDQAIAFDTLIKMGTFKKAAEKLGKGHSAVMYLIKSLEQETALTLLDRSGYRNKLTPEGELIHKHCLDLIKSRNQMAELCLKLQSGWEPKLSLVYDGVINFQLIIVVLKEINESEIPTEIRVSAAYLDEVEAVFQKSEEDFMLTVLPSPNCKGPSITLNAIRMHQVASPNNILASQKSISNQQLLQSTLVRVRGNNSGVGLSTESLEQVGATILVNDFTTKRQAIISGLGYGWLPEYLISEDLKAGDLIRLNTEIKNQHLLYPKLFHKESQGLGKGARAMLSSFEKFKSDI